MHLQWAILLLQCNDRPSNSKEQGHAQVRRPTSKSCDAVDRETAWSPPPPPTASLLVYSGHHRSRVPTLLSAEEKQVHTNTLNHA